MKRNVFSFAMISLIAIMMLASCHVNVFPLPDKDEGNDVSFEDFIADAAIDYIISSGLDASLSDGNIEKKNIRWEENGTFKASASSRASGKSGILSFDAVFDGFSPDSASSIAGTIRYSLQIADDLLTGYIANTIDELVISRKGQTESVRFSTTDPAKAEGSVDTSVLTGSDIAVFPEITGIAIDAPKEAEIIIVMPDGSSSSLDEIVSNPSEEPDDPATEPDDPTEEPENPFAEWIQDDSITSELSKDFEAAYVVNMTTSQTGFYGALYYETKYFYADAYDTEINIFDDGGNTTGYYIVPGLVGDYSLIVEINKPMVLTRYSSDYATEGTMKMIGENAGGLFTFDDFIASSEKWGIGTDAPRLNGTYNSLDHTFDDYSLEYNGKTYDQDNTILKDMNTMAKWLGMANRNSLREDNVFQSGVADEEAYPDTFSALVGTYEEIDDGIYRIEGNSKGTFEFNDSHVFEAVVGTLSDDDNLYFLQVSIDGEKLSNTAIGYINAFYNID